MQLEHSRFTLSRPTAQTRAAFAFMLPITAICLSVCVLGLGLATRAQAATITTFDVPGSTATDAYCINHAGEITGSSIDFNGLVHGFVRTPGGAITTFDPPGSTRTDAYSINDAGAITGRYFDSAAVAHGFVRDPGGTLPHSTLAARSTPNPAASTRRGRSPDYTVRAFSCAVFCAVLTALSSRLTRRARP